MASARNWRSPRATFVLITATSALVFVISLAILSSLILPGRTFAEVVDVRADPIDLLEELVRPRAVVPSVEADARREEKVTVPRTLRPQPKWKHPPEAPEFPCCRSVGGAMRTTSVTG